MMKKRFLGILLCLCMVLMLCPATAFAEGETPEPITQIAVEVDPPIVGEHPEFGCGYSSTPTGVIYVNLDDWYRISKEAYTGEADDVWEGMFDTGNTCSEAYYYKVVFSVGIYSDENCYIPDDVNATINDKNCDIQVADDGNSCLMSYIFEANVLQPVSNIAVTLDEPTLGNTPDFSPEFTANPDGSVSLDECFWYKISEYDYTGTDEDEWDEIYEDDVFEEGYYYSVDLYFTPNENYSLNEGISATVNGKPHDDTYGSVYDEMWDLEYAYVSGVFVPLEPQYTLTVPFTTAVTLGDSGVPGETVFDLEIVGTNAGDAGYADVTVSGSVTTDGAGEYEGVMTFTGPESQLWNMLCEGAFVQQADAGEKGWTYDDTVWGLYLWQGVAELAMDDMAAATGYTVVVVPAECEETEDGVYYYIDWDADPLDEMRFENVYTAHEYELKYDETDHWGECGCGDVQNKEAHQYGEWTVTKKATETEEGEKEHTCTVCGYQETAEIAKLSVADTTNPAADTTNPAADTTNPVADTTNPAADTTNPGTGTPQTGDNSNLTLWLALLTVSAAVVIGTGVYSKCRRSSRAK